MFKKFYVKIKKTILEPFRFVITVYKLFQAHAYEFDTNDKNWILRWGLCNNIVIHSIDRFDETAGSPWWKQSSIRRYVSSTDKGPYWFNFSAYANPEILPPFNKKEEEIIPTPLQIISEQAFQQDSAELLQKVESNETKPCHQEIVNPPIVPQLPLPPAINEVITPKEIITNVESPKTPPKRTGTFMGNMD